MVKIGIVMPVLKHWQGAVMALHSAKSMYHDIQPYIIDNWNFNRGVSGAWNLGIKNAIVDRCDYIIVINDDILFAPCTLDNLIKRFDAATDDVVMYTASNHRGNMHPAEIYTMHGPISDSTAESPDFACFMVKPDIFEQVGTFDENIYPAYFEDNDYHHRIKLLGYHAYSTTYAPYYHFGSVTQNLDPFNPTVPAEKFLANKEYFVNKWGGEPGSERFTTPFNTGLSPKVWKKEWRVFPE